MSRKQTDENLNKAESAGWGIGDGLQTLLGEKREERLVVGKGRGIKVVRDFCFCKADAIRRHREGSKLCFPWVMLLNAINPSLSKLLHCLFQSYSTFSS